MGTRDSLRCMKSKLFRSTFSRLYHGHDTTINLGSTKECKKLVGKCTRFPERVLGITPFTELSLSRVKSCANWEGPRTIIVTVIPLSSFHRFPILGKPYLTHTLGKGENHHPARYRTDLTCRPSIFLCIPSVEHLRKAEALQGAARKCHTEGVDADGQLPILFVESLSLRSKPSESWSIKSQELVLECCYFVRVCVCIMKWKIKPYFELWTVLKGSHFVFGNCSQTLIDEMLIKFPPRMGGDYQPF